MDKQGIKYIENDVEGIIATQATLLTLNLDAYEHDMKDAEERMLHVINTLMYLHKHYSLIKK